ncbi:MAG: phage tail sheath subtilisin-like domain-containing protein [Saprospiraceae bacterium]|jgi:hypothetical protein|nr:phage tail sheath subtilisin-like domain-containing protein [Saprospiraceae bacterium]
MDLTSLKTPGVYIEEVPKFPPSVAAVETAIPAFIGYTQRAVKDKVDLHEGGAIAVVRISSFAEYIEYFGEAQAQSVTVNIERVEGVLEPVSATLSATNFRMYYAVRMFYANGGGPCHIVSVGNYSATIDAARMGVNAGNGGLDQARKIDEVTMLVFPDANGLADDADFYNLFSQGLQQCSALMDRVTLVDTRNGALAATTQALRDANLDSASLKYGAAYTPWLKTLYNHNTPNANVTLSFPDDTLPPNDGNADRDTITIAAALALPANSPVKPIVNDALLAKVKTLLARERVLLPPSSAIAGVFAAVDNSRGVWKAPANVSVSDIIEPVIRISDEDQRDLNIHGTGKSINAIRSFTGKGTLVWGARTLTGNDNEWRYVSVRRFFNMVEESVKKSSEQFVFEPNDANTWVKVQAMIENFLNTLWRVGAMQGAKPEHAYYVSVGLGKTMTPLDVLEGRMIVEIGMAVVRPAEFIVLRFSHKMAES